MGHGIDDSLAHGIGRDFVIAGCLGACFSGSDGAVELREDEVDRLIDEFKGGSLVDLVGGDGLGDFGAVEVETLDLGGEAEALRLFPKEQDGRIGGMGFIEEVQSSQYLRDLGSYR